MMLVGFLSGLSLGVFVGWWASCYAIRKAQALRCDLAAELRSPVDLEPCEFTAHWQVRP